MDPKKVSDRIHAQVAGYLSDFQGQSEPHTDVLSGKHRESPILKESMKAIDQGTCTLHDLGRAYKHTPHAPPAILLKYIAHRVNNVDAYESPVAAHVADHDFMSSVRAGSAKEQNHLVTPRHLNAWLNQNPGLIDEALENKAKVQARVVADDALHLRKINGEPHVAVTRGLDTRTMGQEMPLASFSDKRDSGFGAYMHHVWMPLNDLWYAFPYAPVVISGDHGHENEWLFSNKGDRYVARPEEVKPSRYADNIDILEGSWGRIGLDPFRKSLGTPEQLKEAATLDPNAFLTVATDPNFNEGVGAHLVALADAGNPKLLPAVALAKEPCLALHKRLIEGLDKGPEENAWLPARMVSDCFNAAKNVGSPMSFNNSQNTERYLRALADYFTRFGEDAESPFNVYYRVLSSARMNDTTVNVLADMVKADKALPGVKHSDMQNLLSDAARFNQHLTQRQLQILSAVPACTVGLLNRPEMLSAAVQENLAKNGEGPDLVSMAYRDDLATQAADALLKRAAHWSNPTLIVMGIAKNPRIPVELIKKHVNAETPAAFAEAVEHGLSSRVKENGPSIVKPLPPGGIE